MGIDISQAELAASAGLHLFPLWPKTKKPVIDKWNSVSLDTGTTADAIAQAESGSYNLGLRPSVRDDGSWLLILDADIKPNKETGETAQGLASLDKFGNLIGLDLIDGHPFYTETGAIYDDIKVRVSGDMPGVEPECRSVRARHLFFWMPADAPKPPGRHGGKFGFPDLEFIFWDEAHAKGPQANGFVVFAGSYVDIPAEGLRKAFQGTYDVVQDPFNIEEADWRTIPMAPKKASVMLGYMRTRPEPSKSSRGRSGASGDGPAKDGERLGVADADELAFLLKGLPAKDFNTSVKWEPIMFACHHACGGDPDGFEAFWLWCARDKTFASAENRESVQKRWESADDDPNTKNCTVSTIFHELKLRGKYPSGFKFRSILAAEAKQQAMAVQRFEDNPTVSMRVLREAAELAALEMSSPEDLMAKGAAYVQKHVRERHIKVQTKTTVEVWRREARSSVDKTGKAHVVYSWERYAESSFKKGRIVENEFQPDDSNKPRTYAEHFIDHDREVLNFEGVVFQPNGGNIYGKLNLWEGFRYQPIEKVGGWSMLEELIRDVICDQDEKAADYLLNWIARMLQFPGLPAESAVAMMGKPGTGKGTLANVLLDILGSHGIHLSSMESLSGRFNSHLRARVMVFADEAICTGDPAETGRIKTMITERRLAYEGKGVDIVEDDNTTHIMLATNNDWIVPVETGDRRFFVVKVSDRRLQDEVFFRALHTQMADGGYEAFLYDMLKRDISAFRPQAIPETEARRAQRQITMKPIEQWIKQLIERGEFPCTFDQDFQSKTSKDPDWDAEPVFIMGARGDNNPKAALRQDYETFLARRRRKGEQWQTKSVGVHEFTEMLKDLNIGIDTAAKVGGRKGYLFPQRSVIAENVRQVLKVNIELDT